MATYSLNEVAKHSSESDCWLALHGSVYDVTRFLEKHPGGARVIMMHAGTDATKAFEANHPLSILDVYGPPFKIGVLVGAKAPELPRRTRGSVAMVDMDGPSMWPPGNGYRHDAPRDATIKYLQAHPPAPKPDKQQDEAKYPPRPSEVASPTAVRHFLDTVLGVGWEVANLSANVVYYLTIAPTELIGRTLFPVRGPPVRPDGRPTKVAVIGAGCSGMSAAWAFNRTDGFDLTVFESTEKVGGHAYTFDYPAADGSRNAIDMGFIFGNHRSYLNLLELMGEVGAQPFDTELSLSGDIDGVRWATDTNLTGPKEDVVMSEGLRAECARFHLLAEKYVENVAYNLVPFGWFLFMFGFSEEWKATVMTPTLITLFISPMSLYGMSARFMFNMFAGKNKFVDLRHAWKCFTVQQGTRDIWARVAREFEDSIRLNTPVRAVRRIVENGEDKVLVVTDDGMDVYDHVLFACSAKATSMLLNSQSYLEETIFGQVRYVGERVVLHTDTSFLPEDPSYVRNFNYKSRPEFAEPELTGVMTQASGQVPASPMPLLTMNPMREPSNIVHEKYCSVHVQDLRHLAVTRVLLPMIQGNGNVWYCGSWTNWLGHSGGVDAGMATAARLGARYPLKNEIVRSEYFNVCAKEMYGPRFDWTTSVRKGRPINTSKL